MQLGIIGLARSGKTTVFNAVTRGSAQVGAYSSSNQPNVGVVNVPDARVDKLAELYKPKKVTYATIQYVDFPAAGESFGKGEGPAGKFINDLARMDALIHVVRAFEDDSVPHPEVSIDAERDIATMDLELAFLDLSIIERRLQRLETEMRSVKAGERDQMQRLKDLLSRMKSGLENEQPLREQGLTEEDHKLLEGSQFLTAKPLMLVVNIGESQLANRSELEAKYQQQYRKTGMDVAVFCGKFEMDLNELSDEEAEEFRASAGVTESGMAGAIRMSYELLAHQLPAAGPDSAGHGRWSAGRGAGCGRKITATCARLIRAEVIRFEELVACGSESGGSAACFAPRQAVHRPGRGHPEHPVQRLSRKS
jgi:hypothetical protein